LVAAGFNANVVCSTDASGSPAVTVRATPTGTSHVFAEAGEATFTGTGSDPITLCTLLLCKAYLFVHLLIAYANDGLPWPQMSMADVYSCADNALSSTDHALFVGDDLDKWRALRLPTCLPDRHPFASVRRNVVPPDRSSSGSIHFSYLSSPEGQSTEPPHQRRPSLLPENSSEAEKHRRAQERAMSSLFNGRRCIPDPDVHAACASFFSGTGERPSLFDLLPELEGKAHARQMLDEEHSDGGEEYVSLSESESESEGAL
jgi:hypothetical protein